MTKQEAIETIKLAMAQIEWDYPMDYAVAFDMAIDALKQPSIIRCISCIFYRSDGLCELRSELRYPDDFCSRGVPKSIHKEVGSDE